VMGWESLPHPPYSLDLAPFGPPKESLGGLEFEDDQQHVSKFFHTTDKDFYKSKVSKYRTFIECIT